MPFLIRLQLALTVMGTVGSCLQFSTVSGVPTTTEDLGSQESDGNQTDWTISSLNFLRQKRHSSRCKSYSRAQLVRKLNRLGSKQGGSLYGGYNRRFMAITWREALKFPNLATTVRVPPNNVSSIRNLPFNPPTRKGTLTSRTNCQTTDGGLKRMCSACPAVTFLGHDRIPKYINEVTCGQATCSHGVTGGICKNALMYQRFYYKTGRCDPITGYEEIKPYTQPIRVCCECMLF